MSAPHDSAYQDGISEFADSLRPSPRRGRTHIQLTKSDPQHHDWYTIQDLQSLPEPDPLVKGFFFQDSLVVMYGPTESAKTFVTLDLALHIATGQAWYGKATARGPVAYILAEGRRQVVKRCLAWLQAHDTVLPNTLRFHLEPVELLEHKNTKRLIDGLLQWDEPPKLVVLDTLAWCMAPGDENLTQDMTAFVAAMGRIRQATGATVWAVHHTGHDTSRERGNSALRAAVDTMVRVTKKGDVISVQCQKQRDGERFGPLQFQFQHSAHGDTPPTLLQTPLLSYTDKEILKTIRKAGKRGFSPHVSDGQIGHVRSTLYKSLEVLLANGDIWKEKRGKEVLYFPSEKPPEANSSKARN